jgi:hypothetical protein
MRSPPTIIGSAKFHPPDNKLQVSYKAKQLGKSTTYRFSIERHGGGPTFLGPPAHLGLTARGVGTVTGAIQVPETDYEVFATAEGNFTFNDSFIVGAPQTPICGVIRVAICRSELRLGVPPWPGGRVF